MLSSCPAQPYIHVTAKGAMSFRMTEGPLPVDVLIAIDDAALKAQPKWPSYFTRV
jgi:hypothetical protein